ncbi:MAG: M13 family metallopeptidase, partial [Pseudomonadota bacterium]|nr:M13 family metallopeptidase [Pseudomonadota bacterium]
GIGMVIGHEITHGFDDHGRQFDERGNLRDWWTADDASQYLARAQRVSAQYGDYAGIDQLHLNGKLTLGENIADIGGLKIAYLGLQRALSRRPQGLIEGRTPEQRFFISFAQIWRTKMTPEFERLVIQSNTHAPPRFRVQGSIANMPEFAQAFSCSPGEGALRPDAERAAIW